MKTSCNDEVRILYKILEIKKKIIIMFSFDVACQLLTSLRSRVAGTTEGVLEGAVESGSRPVHLKLLKKIT